MTVLHRVTEVTRKIGIGFGIGILSIIFVFVTFRLFTAVRQIIAPIPPPPPTTGYGKLPQILFPVSIVSTLPQIQLNTVSGSLPQFDDRMRVYAFQQPQVNFSSFDSAKAAAANNGFISDPTSLSDTIYQWKNSSFLNRTLTLNVLNFDFSLSTDYLQNSTVSGGNNLGDPPSAVTTVKNYFSNFLSTLPSDIDDTKTQTSLFSIQNNALIPATSLSGADIIRVDFYQNDINQIPIYYPHYPASLLEGFVGSGDTGPQIVAATYVHRVINQTSFETYPIKTAQQAFDDLKKGNGYIANYDTPTLPAIIRNVTLGYYIGDNPAQKYLMPIIVFEGDNNFYAFVSAITNAWVQK